MDQGRLADWLDARFGKATLTVERISDDGDPVLNRAANPLIFDIGDEFTIQPCIATPAFSGPTVNSRSMAYAGPAQSANPASSQTMVRLNLSFQGICKEFRRVTPDITHDSSATVCCFAGTAGARSHRRTNHS